jgi:hypothetical protein
MAQPFLEFALEFAAKSSNFTDAPTTPGLRQNGYGGEYARKSRPDSLLLRVTGVLPSAASLGAALGANKGRLIDGGEDAVRVALFGHPLM